MKTKKAVVYHASIEELGGDEYVVVADTVENAQAELLRAWREYDRKHHSDYRGQVKSFADLHEIYGARVVALPLNKAVAIDYLETAEAPKRTGKTSRRWAEKEVAKLAGLR